jgi:Ca2+-binding EF-hand superfamily protein
MDMSSVNSSSNCSKVPLPTTIGSGMSTFNGKSVDEIIKSCDKDGNGIIDYNEFKTSLLG